MKLNTLLLVIITTLIAVAVGFYLGQNTNRNLTQAPQEQGTPSETKEITEDIFKITGYPTIMEYGDSENGIYSSSRDGVTNCMEEYCPAFKYVMFNITETDSDEILDFLKQRKSNQYADENGVGLGCLDDNRIYYNYFSSSSNKKEYNFSQDTSKKILNATKSNPTTILLKKEPSEFEGGAPICFSYFTVSN